MTVLFKSLFIFLFSGLAMAKPVCLDDTKAAFAKGEQLRSEGQYLLSLQQYAAIASFACGETEKASAHLGSAQSLFRLGETLAAEQALKDLFSGGGPESTKAKGKLLLAWYEPETRGRLSATDQASFMAYEENVARLKHENRRKNPWVAGVSSALIPGLGQVYNGNYQSAAFSFVLNSLFLATALELNRKDLQTSSLAAGALFSITYVGSIVGSVESANTINRNSARPLIEQERKTSLPGLEL